MSDNVATLLRMLEKSGAGDHAGAMAQMHDDVVIDEPMGLPYGGVWHGSESSAEIKRISRTAWISNLGPLGTWDCGDVIFTYRAVSWTSIETGKSAESKRLERFEFRDGKIARIDVFIHNVAGLLATLEP